MSVDDNVAANAPTKKKQAYLRKWSQCLQEIKGPKDPKSHRDMTIVLVDYGMPEITGDRVRAASAAPGTAIPKEFNSGWHYHECDLQLAVIFDGSVEGGDGEDCFYRASRDEIVFIPGRTVHIAREPSADYYAMEFTFPGSFDTHKADMPKPGTPMSSQVWGVGSAIGTGRRERGVANHAYPVPSSLSDRYRVERETRTRIDDYEPGDLEHDDSLQIRLVTKGWRDVIVDGERQRLGVADILVIPEGGCCREAAVSDDHEAILIRLLR